MEKAKIISLKNTIDYQENSIVSKKILENKNGGLTLFAFDAKQRLSEHTAPFDAIIQVIEGEGEILINQVPHLLTQGEMIIMPANIPHAVNAHKAFKMLLTMVKENK